MNRLTDKPGWEKKIFDKNIVAKWKNEALSAPGVDISEKMVEWVSQYFIASSYIKIPAYYSC